MDDSVVQESKVAETKFKQITEDVCKPWTCKIDIPGFKYKTSSGIGLKYTPPPTDLRLGKPIENLDLLSRGYRYKNLRFKTTSSVHDGKSHFNDPLGQANRIRGTRCHFLKEYQEGLKFDQPNRISPWKSNYKSDYVMHEIKPDQKGEIVDVRPDIYCKIKGIARDDQPKVDLSSGSCLLSSLDNYVTTNKADYVYISPERRKQYSQEDIKIKTKPVKKLEFIYEEMLFRMRFLDKVLPQKLKRVPHSGIKTEFESAYTNQWGRDNFSEDLVVYPAVTFRQTKGEVMAVPGMYHTDYSHLGSKWAVDSLV